MIEKLPKEIVAELDSYIIGQSKAKKALSIALRNRWRRLLLSEPMRSEVMPKNILMVGPTGVGKTELARRLAKLTNAPFIKVEATKFTEVGYVGKSVDSIIKDLAKIAYNMVEAEGRKANEQKAREEALKKIIQDLKKSTEYKEQGDFALRQRIIAGELDNVEISIEPNQNKSPLNMEILMPTDMDEAAEQLQNLMSGIKQPRRHSNKKMKVKDALEHYIDDITEDLIADSNLNKDTITLVEEKGIVFIDEIDKISARDAHFSDVSREGVQRDLLPLIEGTVINTKYGNINTDHILFIASGAFHLSKPSDLLPELQGRLPINVELDSLSEEDFFNILKSTKYSIISQYSALLSTEGLVLNFDDEAIRAIANIAFELNIKIENLGARRLHSLLEIVLEDISYHTDELAIQYNKSNPFIITRQYILEKLSNITKTIDTDKYLI